MAILAGNGVWVYGKRTMNHIISTALPKQKANHRKKFCNVYPAGTTDIASKKMQRPCTIPFLL